MPGNVVCAGAMCQCNQGASTSPLAVTSQQVMKIDGQLVATVADSQPDSNIKPFGNCKLLTQAASGTPTPCVPALNGPWSQGAVVGQAMGQAVVTINSTLACSVGGEITIASGNCNVQCNVQ